MIIHDSFALAANTAKVIATVPVGNPLTSVVITNVDAASVYIGDSTVSTGDNVNRGIKVATNTNQQVWLNGGESLYAISLSGTTGAFNVSVLYSLVVTV